MGIFRGVISLAISCAALTILHNVGFMISTSNFFINIINAPVVSGAGGIILFIYFALMLFISLNVAMWCISFFAMVPWVVRLYGAYAFVFLLAKAIAIYSINGLVLSVLIPYVFFIIGSIFVILTKKDS